MQQLKKIAWFIGIWTASVAVLGVVAYGIRLMIGV
ncbi:DUF2474 domain-containing protein [Loktanella sp. S4079]|nr:DUF2474 domain-containing protein [Loktanella sp. S4079]